MSATPTYQWLENWARIPDSDSGRANGRTHGVCVAADGRVIVFHQADNGLVTYDPDGRLMSAVGGTRWHGAHGMTLVTEGKTQYLWLVDQASCEIAKVTLDGETVQTLKRADHPAYFGDKKKNYCPTWAAQNPLNGDIWVGDGYGSSLVHRYTRGGDYIATIDGASGAAGAFREPHGVNFRIGKGGGAELWVTDRANHRIQVFDGNGNYLRSSLTCHSPCCFDFLGDQVIVPELFTGIKVIDAESLALVVEVGASEEVGPRPDGAWWPPVAPAGWPNLAGTPHVHAGAFNSPHGGCFAPNGDIYVVEWIVGGRITKLKKLG